MMVRRRRVIRKRPVFRNRIVRDWNRGYEDGYRQGWDSGYFLGQADSIVDRAPDPARRWDVKVLFVKADGVPYAFLNQGIDDGLRRIVRETFIAEPGQDPVRMAAEIRPDLMLVLDALNHTFPAVRADEVRAMGIKTAVWLPDDPYHTDLTIQIAPHYDYVFTFEKSCVYLYQQLGCQHVYYVAGGANTRYIRPQVVDDEYRSDICFIGSAFWKRVELIDSIAPYLATKRLKIIGYWWDRLKHYSLLANRIHSYWLTPEETAKYYAGAKIVINLHRANDDPTHNTNSRLIPALSVNPRLFEISACGTLQISDEREELQHYYTPGKEIETFATPEELVRKIEFYLNHEKERRDIALRALDRTVHEHSYVRRLANILDIVFGPSGG